ncbi:MAG: glycoside hydrolase family 15 protein [Acidobacteriota bacterium]|nr:glycoside hydrolase family 15 protein [Acidobacteriota bacterium]
MAYKSIDSYGLIGDLHTAVLVGTDGSMDWGCFPDFDSPSVFGAILDENKGGHFKICSTREGRARQMYLPDTNVLVTRFLDPEGVGEVIDFLALGEVGRKWREVVRISRCVRGTVKFRMECAPRFDYARAEHRIILDGNRARFTSGEIRMDLTSTIELREHQGQAAVCEFQLQEGERASFVLRYAPEEKAVAETDLNRKTEEQMQATIAYWKEWAERCKYQGRWREMVVRSALALKMLTYAPTGAIIAAPTCSLPEVIGGERNWDYRYTWIRDAAFTIYAFLRLGYFKEATAFMEWLHQRCKENQETGPIQVMYRINGSAALKEFELEHLEGYRGSRPVRVGNAAADQLQLDIYGELIDSIYLYNKYVEPISWDLWGNVRQMLDWLCDNWERPDHSIWEVRSGPQQYTYSKMQCWVALDRGIRIARKRNLPFHFERVLKETHRIYEAIMEKGWSEEKRSFTQTFGGNAADATSLLFPLMLFVAPRDPRMEGTLKRVQEELVSDSLVYRYKAGPDDGMNGVEGTFSVCTFWMVEALARAGRVDEARLTFEKMLTYANPVGLYAEEIGPSGEAMGNFPQAFTHLGLISAAITLDRVLG